MEHVFIALIYKTCSLTVAFISAQWFHITTFSHFWPNLHCMCISYCFIAEMVGLSLFLLFCSRTLVFGTFRDYMDTSAILLGYMPPLYLLTWDIALLSHQVFAAFKYVKVSACVGENLVARLDKNRAGNWAFSIVLLCLWPLEGRISVHL